MNGRPDTLKGSFYANPLADSAVVPEHLKQKYPEYYGVNICESCSSLASIP